VSPPYAASLRVYEPLSAFPAGERERWRDYVAADRAPDRSAGPRLEHEVALVAALTGRLLPSVDHAYVHRVDGSVLICPWRTQLRAAQALEDLPECYPELVLDALVPAPAREAALARHADLAAHQPDQRAYIQTSTWVVPLRWFVLFDPTERVLSLGRRPAGSPGGGPVRRADSERILRYRTRMAHARRRVARALAVLHSNFDDVPMVDEVEELGRWLEEFHPWSLVELDYGGLVDLHDDLTLRADQSAADVAATLKGLSAGDRAAAMSAYERVIDRWRRAALLESAN